MRTDTAAAHGTPRRFEEKEMNISTLTSKVAVIAAALAVGAIAGCRAGTQAGSSSQDPPCVAAKNCPGMPGVSSLRGSAPTPPPPSTALAGQPAEPTENTPQPPPGLMPGMPVPGQRMPGQQ